LLVLRPDRPFSLKPRHRPFNRQLACSAILTHCAFPLPVRTG
jgi:hypothetical protein